MLNNAALTAQTGGFFLFFEKNVYFCVYSEKTKTLANAVIARATWHADDGTRTLRSVLRMHKSCARWRKTRHLGVVICAYAYIVCAGV